MKGPRPKEVRKELRKRIDLIDAGRYDEAAFQLVEWMHEACHYLKEVEALRVKVSRLYSERAAHRRQS